MISLGTFILGAVLGVIFRDIVHNVAHASLQRDGRCAWCGQRLKGDSK